MCVQGLYKYNSVAEAHRPPDNICKKESTSFQQTSGTAKREEVGTIITTAETGNTETHDSRDSTESDNPGVSPDLESDKTAFSSMGDRFGDIEEHTLPGRT